MYAAMVVSLVILHACGSKRTKPAHIAATPEELQQKITNYIGKFLQQVSAGNRSTAGSSLQLSQPVCCNYLYEKNENMPLWCEQGNWKPPVDSLLSFIQESKLYGLFPQDYHANELSVIRKLFEADSLGKTAKWDALKWARSDVLLTDAFIQMLNDIKLGRLPNDSITLNKDTLLGADFFLQQYSALQQHGSMTALVQALEPQHGGYQQLKKGIPKFLQQADFKEHTPVPSSNDPGYKIALQKRLYEGGYIAFDSVMADSVQLAEAVKKFQKEKKLTVDGKAGEGTIRMLNLSDKEKFIRIAISLDKYKKLPYPMPSRYIWVNASSNYLDVVQDGRVEFSSKVICGKPKTRTPLLNGAISQLITYPQWVPPPSIVTKEILPAVKKNPGYLSRKGFILLDKEGNEINPYSVDWSKYSKVVPYKIVQGSGDANALGVLKFYFDNKYSVYLHDTNQRYLFGNAMRSQSHGCVRVQEWQKLAFYILRNDSLHSSGKYRMADSLKTWLDLKIKRHITVKRKMPVYIRYITCEGRSGSLVFYDDVYGEDKMLREKYFTGK